MSGYQYDINSLRNHGKSFYWASFFLPHQNKLAASELYSICRYFDDLADDSEKDLNESYEQVKSELRNYSTKLIKKKELVVLNKVDLVDEGTVKDVIDHFSKGKDCEIMTMTTLEKDSISKIKAKLLSYVS